MRTKKSMRIQKIVFYGFLIASFLIVIASLAFVADSWVIFNAQKMNKSTGLYYDLRTSVRLAMMTSSDFADKYSTAFGGGVYSLIFDNADTAINYYRNFWFDIQAVNNMLFYTGIVSLCGVAVCGIVGSFTRKKYYVSNLVAGCVTGAFGIIMSLVIMGKCFSLMSKFDFVQADADLYIESTIAGGGSPITNSVNGNNCWLGVAVGICFILICGGFIAYNVIRFIQTRKIIASEEVTINE